MQKDCGFLGIHIYSKEMTNIIFPTIRYLWGKKRRCYWGRVQGVLKTLVMLVLKLSNKVHRYLSYYLK